RKLAETRYAGRFKDLERSTAECAKILEEYLGESGTREFAAEEAGILLEKYQEALAEKTEFIGELPEYLVHPNLQILLRQEQMALVAYRRRITFFKTTFAANDGNYLRPLDPLAAPQVLDPTEAAANTA